LLASFVFQDAYGSDEKVAAKAKKTFEMEFPGALTPKWEKIPNSSAYSVRFVYKNQALVSYIDEDGTVLAIVRCIRSESLPFRINETYDRKYGSYKLSSIEELNSENEISYLFSVENEKEKIYVRIFQNGSFNEIRRQRLN
ncbi:MAG TPA: hypothetical protein VFO70_02530, partial [Chitinophagaceae bacterium]|nr:hypothetical protein [Chitinophagaceae bacterium]